jgi:hypothetical protein
MIILELGQLDFNSFLSTVRSQRAPYKILFNFISHVLLISKPTAMLTDTSYLWDQNDIITSEHEIGVFPEYRL